MNRPLSIYRTAVSNKGKQYTYEFGGKQYTVVCESTEIVWLYTPTGLEYLKNRFIMSIGEAPNWTIQFSVHPDDLARAFDISSDLFMKSGGLVGIRASPKLKGRELTFYVYQDSPLASPFDLHQTKDFWSKFTKNVDHLFHTQKIRYSELPYGNKFSGISSYASIRNEAFVNGKYPEETDGWNAAKQAIPYTLLPFSY